MLPAEADILSLDSSPPAINTKSSNVNTVSGSVAVASTTKVFAKAVEDDWFAVISVKANVGAFFSLTVNVFDNDPVLPYLSDPENITSRVFPLCRLPEIGSSTLRY